MELKKIEAGKYGDKLFKHITGGEGFKCKIYDDGKGIPTIGYGHNVFRNGRSEEVITSSLSKAGITLSSSEVDELVKIGKQDRESAKASIKAFNWTTKIDETKGRKLFDNDILGTRNALKNHINTHEKGEAGLYEKYANTQEMIALEDLAYNGGNGLFGPGIIQALKDGNRQAVCYEIAYNTNGPNNDPNVRSGLANRYYGTADTFGLFDNPHNVKGSELKNLSTIYTDKKSKIDSYASKFTYDKYKQDKERNFDGQMDKIAQALDDVYIDSNEKYSIKTKGKMEDTLNEYNSNLDDLLSNNPDLKSKTNDDNSHFILKEDDKIIIPKSGPNNQDVEINIKNKKGEKNLICEFTANSKSGRSLNNFNISELQDYSLDAFDSVNLSFISLLPPLTDENTKYSDQNYLLSSGEKNLILTGFNDKIKGYGNSLDNYIQGNIKDNNLWGREGNDILSGGGGNDFYGFFKGDGIDIIYDSIGDNDTINFGSNVSKEDIAIFQDAGRFFISYGDYTYDDLVVIHNQTSGKIQLANGMYLDENDVSQIIQDMTNYAAQNDFELSSIEHVKENQDLMNIVVSAWHS